MSSLSFRSRLSFTLIELLVVTSIIAVLAGVIGACLAGGIRAWDAARDFIVVEADALIDLEIMQRDLMNAVRFKEIDFRGNKTQVSFPSLVDDGSSASTLRIGTVSYVFDRDKGAFFRKAWVYPLDGSSVLGNGRETVSDLRGVNLQFYQSPIEDGAQGAWLPSWENATNHPSRLKISFMFVEGLQPEIITRTIIMPLGK